LWEEYILNIFFESKNLKSIGNKALENIFKIYRGCKALDFEEFLKSHLTKKQGG